MKAEIELFKLKIYGIMFLNDQSLKKKTVLKFPTRDFGLIHLFWQF